MTVEEQKTDEPETEGLDSQGNDDEELDAESILEKLELDPKVKQYIQALKDSKQSANDDSKKQRLVLRNLKTLHGEAVSKLKDAEARLKEIDDRDKPALQKATERVAELENELNNLRQAKAQLETNSFLLGNGVPQKHLKAVALLVADAMEESGLDQEQALATIKEEHPFLWPSTEAPKEEKKAVVKKPVTTGTPPTRESGQQQPKPKSLAEIGRRSSSAADRKAFEQQMKAMGIRL